MNPVFFLLIWMGKPITGLPIFYFALCLQSTFAEVWLFAMRLLAYIPALQLFAWNFALIASAFGCVAGPLFQQIDCESNCVCGRRSRRRR